MLIDLEQMRSMLQSALSLPRNDRRIEAVMQVDIAGTQQLIADQFGDSKLAIERMPEDDIVACGSRSPMAASCHCQPHGLIVRMQLPIWRQPRLAA